MQDWQINLFKNSWLHGSSIPPCYHPSITSWANKNKKWNQENSCVFSLNWDLLNLLRWNNISLQQLWSLQKKHVVCLPGLFHVSTWFLIRGLIASSSMPVSRSTSIRSSAPRFFNGYLPVTIHLELWNHTFLGLGLTRSWSIRTTEHTLHHLTSKPQKRRQFGNWFSLFVNVKNAKKHNCQTNRLVGLRQLWLWLQTQIPTNLIGDLPYNGAKFKGGCQSIRIIGQLMLHLPCKGCINWYWSSISYYQNNSIPNGCSIVLGSFRKMSERKAERGKLWCIYKYILCIYVYIQIIRIPHTIHQIWYSPKNKS